MTTQFETASTIARRLGIAPRLISDQFYSRRLDDSRCPIVQGRRLIPEDYVPEVERVLIERGFVGSPLVTHHEVVRHA